MSETNPIIQILENMNPETAKSLLRIGESIVEDEKRRQENQPAKLKTGEVVQLPLWPEPTVGTPDVFLRSALFAATDKTHEGYSKKTPITSVVGYTVKYMGNQLTQFHLIVWEALIHLARQHPLGDECCFTGNSFFKMLGYKKSPGKDAYELLDNVITSLTGCVVEVNVLDKIAYGAGLIDWYVRDSETKAFKIKLNRGLVALYGCGQWTQLQWKQRLALKNKPLALWLHGFYSTHAIPLPVSVEFLRDKSGSSIKELKHFRQALKKALNEIKADGVITDWRIDEKADLVHVTKIPTLAQIKHLKKPSK